MFAITNKIRVSLVAAVAALAAGVAASAAHAATSTLATSSPAGLEQSTGNLYWTSNSVVRGPGGTVTEYVGSVWRASKSNVPGSEQLLYRETDPFGPVWFGGLQWALVGGQYYAYFVRNSYDSKIERVPLTGGSATVMAVSPTAISDYDSLVTDGTNLYWVGSGGIYEMSLGGGPVTTLVSDQTVGGSYPPVIGLDGSYVYYASRLYLPSGVKSQLRRVPKVGGPSSLVVNDTQQISAMYIMPAGFYSEYYLGHYDGSVIAGNTIGGVTATLRGSIQGSVRVTSISRDTNNGYILWGLDGINLSGTVVQVVQYDAAATIHSVPVTAWPFDVQGDGTAMYWGGDTGLEKATF
jgi:hypothetical protein